MFGTATFRIDLTDEKAKLEEFISRSDIVIMDIIYCNEYNHNVAYLSYKRSKTGNDSK